MRRGLAIVAGFAAAGGAWAGWSLFGRSGPRTPVVTNLDGHADFGEPSGAGDVLAVQPAVEPADFASSERLHEKLNGYLVHAAAHGGINADTVVVFPEHIGTWLLVAHEKRRVYESPDLAGAASIVCASNLPLFGRELLRAPVDDKATWALFAFKAEVIARSYEAVFAALAREHKCTVVAGSVVLPDPSIVDGRLLPGTGPLRNVSVTFGANGRPLGPPSPRCFPDPGERAFTEAGDVEDLHVYASPVGRLGVLLGRDAFQPLAHAALAREEVDVLVVPAFLDGDEAWTRVFAGTPGTDLPPDIPPSDVGRLTEAEAWLAHGPPSRLAQSGARAQVTTFLKGRLWDRATDGAVLATVGGHTFPGPLVGGGSWVRVHLPTPDSRP